MTWTYGDPITLVLLNGTEEVTERIRYEATDPKYPVRHSTDPHPEPHVTYYFTPIYTGTRVRTDRIAFFSDDGQLLAYNRQSPIEWDAYPGDTLVATGDLHLVWKLHEE